MSFKCGIVGLPNVGKSTLFNALTRSGIEAQNYPFTTIEPNVGIAKVADNRIDYIASKVNPISTTFARVEFVDIAGLVKGASQGEGLGNKFLNHIRMVDAIVQVVRCFDDENITHVSGAVDPMSDIDTINTELLISDIQILENNITKMTKLSKNNDPLLRSRLAKVTKVHDALLEGTLAITLFQKYPELIDSVEEYNLITAKPIVFVANVREDELHIDNEYVKIVSKYAASVGRPLVKISARVESEISQLDEEDLPEFLSSLGLEYSGLELLASAGYEALNLITYFTAGEKEVRAWSIMKDTQAAAAAGKIHTDIERGFIRAEVCSYEDFVAHGSVNAAKEAGRVRLEGKDYVVQDGDIMYFRFNV